LYSVWHILKSVPKISERSWVRARFHPKNSTTSGDQRARGSIGNIQNKLVNGKGSSKNSSDRSFSWHTAPETFNWFEYFPHFRPARGSNVFTCLNLKTRVFENADANTLDFTIICTVPLVATTLSANPQVKLRIDRKYVELNVACSSTLERNLKESTARAIVDSRSISVQSMARHDETTKLNSQFSTNEHSVKCRPLLNLMRRGVLMAT
jgi:hypothetical protein